MIMKEHFNKIREVKSQIKVNLYWTVTIKIRAFNIKFKSGINDRAKIFIDFSAINQVTFYKDLIKNRVQTLSQTIRKTQLLRIDSGKKDDKRGEFHIKCNFLRFLLKLSIY